MPINYADYPPDWREIRARILTRDENRCKFCGVPNGVLVYRDPDNPALFQIVPDPISEADVYRIFGGKPITELSKTIKIVLTIAHLDHDLTHNDDENLAALCQRCHLVYDAAIHADHASETRRRKREQASGQMRLIDL